MTENYLFTNEDMKAIGNRIQEERKKKGIKAIDFADVIGIGKDQLSRIENGKVTCKLEYLFVIAKYLEVSSDYLLYGKTSYDAQQMLNNLSVEKLQAIMSLIMN